MYQEEILEQAVIHLSEIAKGVKPIDKGKGICAYLNKCLGNMDINDLLVPHFKTWPKFSGASHFPIMDEALVYDPTVQYNMCKKWQGKQWKLRKELAKHLVTELQKELTNRQGV